MCLGLSFGLMEVKVVIAALLQRYRLELPPGLRVDCKETFALQTKRPLMVTVRPQDHQFKLAKVKGNIHSLLDVGYRV
jgi:cytochrome P450